MGSLCEVLYSRRASLTKRYIPLGLFLLGSLFGTSSLEASILTFDTCGGSGTAAILTNCSGGSVNPNYGDRVTSTTTDANGTQDRSYGESGEGFTPNITVGYSSGFGWGTGFSNLTNVIYTDGASGLLDITFSADSGFRARLLGFSLGAFLPPQNGFQGVSVSIFDESNTQLFTQSYSVAASDVNQVISVQSGDGGFLRLRLDVTALNFNPGIFDFSRESVGIDNIRFAQAATTTEPPPSGGDVPEPSTFALVGGVALIGALLRRR
jgi:hypothetical protein